MWGLVFTEQEPPFDSIDCYMLLAGEKKKVFCTSLKYKSTVMAEVLRYFTRVKVLVPLCRNNKFQVQFH